MNMQPIQGPSEKIQFLINDNMQVKSSWGKRVVTAETPNNRTLTLPLKDIVAVLENQVKSAKSPEEIKRTREMLVTIKKLESGSRNPLTKFLSLIGIKNAYDTKFQTLNQNIKSKEIIALGRDSKIEQMKTLETKLEKLLGKIEVARKDADKEINENFFNRNPDGSDWDDIAQSRLEELEEKEPEKMNELNLLRQVLKNSYPEYEKFGNEVGNVQEAAYKKYDELHNIGNTEARLMGAEIAAKEASGKKLNAQEENTIKFLESLNEIPKELKLEVKNDPLLLKKKENFITNLKADSPVLRLMENDQLKKLADEMDKDLSPYELLQNFALYTVNDYRVDMGFIDEKDMDNAFIALILLQKNSSFENALNDLHPYTNENLEVSAYKNAFAKINELEIVRSEIDEINVELTNVPVWQDDKGLNERLDALHARVQELGS